MVIMRCLWKEKGDDSKKRRPLFILAGSWCEGGVSSECVDVDGDWFFDLPF